MSASDTAEVPVVDVPRPSRPRPGDGQRSVPVPRPAPPPPTPGPAPAPSMPAPAPAPPPGPRPRTGPRTSRVVVRRLDPWSVLKVSLLFYLSCALVLVTAAVLLWALASSLGLVTNIEGFMEDIGFEDFRFLPGRMLGGTAVASLVLALAGTFGNVLMAALYNLISDVVGGFKLTLAEDEGRRRKV